MSLTFLHVLFILFCLRSQWTNFFDAVTKISRHYEATAEVIHFKINSIMFVLFRNDEKIINIVKNIFYVIIVR